MRDQHAILRFVPDTYASLPNYHHRMLSGMSYFDRFTDRFFIGLFFGNSILRPMPPADTTLDHSIGTSFVAARLRSSTAVPFAESSFHGNIGTSLITALGLSVLIAHSPLLGVAVASLLAADFSVTFAPCLLHTPPFLA